MSHPLDFLNPHEQPENECGFCGAPCDNDFCSKDCKKADVQGC